MGLGRQVGDRPLSPAPPPEPGTVFTVRHTGPLAHSTGQPLVQNFTDRSSEPSGQRPAESIKARTAKDLLQHEQVTEPTRLTAVQ